MLEDLGWLKKVKIWDGERTANITPENELRVALPGSRLFDQHFNDTSLPSAIWNINNIGSGSASSSGSFCNLNVTTANGDSSEVYSTQTFVHIFSKTLSFKCGVVLNEVTLNNNVRLWGMRNPVSNDGWYFRLRNGILEACTEHIGVVTAVNIDSYKPTDGYVHRFDAIYRNCRVMFYVDGVEVHCEEATIDHLFDNEELQVYFRNYNTGITSTGVELQIEGIALFDDTSSIIEIVGVDEDGLLRKVATTKLGRLKISTAPPEAPPATTPVNVTQYSSVNDYADDVYVIPSGETLLIQRFSAGAETDSNAGNVVELWDDSLGTGVGMTIIDMIFCSGDGDQHDLREEIVGDGTRAIRMRRRRFSGGSKEIFGRWEGYY